MKQLLGLLLCCLLLAGCTQAPSATQPAPTQEPVMLYAPDSPMEQSTFGGVLSFPLPYADSYGLRSLGQDLLVLSGTDTTTLTRIDGTDPHITATRQLSFRLESSDPSLQETDLGLSYYDPTRWQLVVLNDDLEPVQTISAPQGMVGAPLLSQDGTQLYYCTANALRCWDRQTNTHRMIREFSQPGQKLLGYYPQSQLLHCLDPQNSREMLLDAQDGHRVWEGSPGLVLHQQGHQIYAALPLGLHQQLLYGTDPSHLTLLSPQRLEKGQFLVQAGCVLTSGIHPEHDICLSLYDLDTGLRFSNLHFPGTLPPVAAETGDGKIYLLAYDQSFGCSVLYRWDPASTPTDDTTVYSGSLNQDLSLCQAYAQSLSQAFGIQILLGQEAADQSPWDYTFQPETQALTLWRQLELLEEGLSQYPPDLLRQAVEPHGGLTICLVRQIAGLPEAGSVDIANGLQYQGEEGCVLALSAGPGSVKTLCHELFHVMESQLLTYSTALDQWENLNPKHFQYAMSYTLTGKQENPSYYLGDGKAFVDRYSMTYPKEDRARIMERAMTPGNGPLFQAPILQAKLQALCIGIRDAFGLEKSPEVFLWEQYLDVPLAQTP